MTQFQNAAVGKNTFWYNKIDRFIGQRIALGKYEPYLTKLFLEYGNGVVADIGANIGYDTVLLAEIAKKVYSFEPDGENFRLLNKNIKENNLKNITAMEAAVGNKIGKIPLFKSTTNLGDHRVFESETQNVATRKVRLVKLDGLIQEKVEMIKIDTQGFEPAVIEGAEKIIAKHKPTIFFEYWPWAYKQANLDYKKMIMFLEKTYGQVYFVDEYVQFIRKVNQKWLDSHFNKEEEQGNLMVSKKINIFKQYKNFWIKKWLKRKLGVFPLT